MQSYGDEKLIQIISNKNEIKALRRKMAFYTDEYQRLHKSAQKQTKLQIFTKLQGYLADFQELLGFTVSSLEYQIEKELAGKDMNDELDNPTAKQNEIV